jgi:hypothetical protein
MPEPITIALLTGAATLAAGWAARRVRNQAQHEAGTAGRQLHRARHLARQMQLRAGHRSGRLLAERSAAIFWLHDRAQHACRQAQVAPPGGLGPLGRSWSEAARWKELLAGLHAQVSGQGPVEHVLNALIAGSLVAKALRSHLPLPDPPDAVAPAATATIPDWLDLSGTAEAADGAAFAASLGAASLHDLMPDLPAGMAADMAADWVTDIPLETLGSFLDLAADAFLPLAVLRVSSRLKQARRLRAEVPKMQHSAQQAAEHTRAMAQLCARLRQREQAEEQAAYAVYKAAMQLEALTQPAGGAPPAGLAAAAARLHAATQAWWRLATQQPTPAAAQAG